jgi:hypothetical protein
MASRSLSRELALLVLGQVSEQNKSSTADLGKRSIHPRRNWIKLSNVFSIVNFNRVRLPPWMLSVIICVHH